MIYNTNAINCFCSALLGKIKKHLPKQHGSVAILVNLERFIRPGSDRLTYWHANTANTFTEPNVRCHRTVTRRAEISTLWLCSFSQPLPAPM